MSSHSSKEPLLRVEHLCQYFGQTKAVDDVSFEIYPGEVFGLVGESGCGKTTTGRSIIKIYNITSGSIYFQNQRIAVGTLSYRRAIRQQQEEMRRLKQEGSPQKLALCKEQMRQLRKALADAKQDHRKTGVVTDIQMIFQDPMASLDPRMTVGEIIAEGLIISGIRDKKRLEQEVLRMLQVVGLLPEHAGRYPHEFSGGQRQRIGIARAIIMKPQLLIADEPISALDVSIQAQVINLLNELRKEFHLTILFIAHDLSVVKYFSDRIGVMYQGKIVEQASAQELFAHPLHPYTKALLSAIPLPDPRVEKRRKRVEYQPQEQEKGQPLREIVAGHFVSCSEARAEDYRREREQ